MSVNLATILGRDARSDDVALIDLSAPAAREYTYADLDGMASGVAAALWKRGLRHGARIGMLCGNSARFYAAYFGGLRAGCTIVPCDPRAGEEFIAHICKDAALELLITDRGTPAGVPDNLEVVPVDSAIFGKWLAPALFAAVTPRNSVPALILYTSGSTGRPKGVVLSHASQIAIIEGLAKPPLQGQIKGGPCIVAAPLFHMNGLAASELAFALGGQVVLMGRFEAQGFLAAIDRYRVTTLSGVPTMVALLAQEREILQAIDLSCVSLVLIGSAPLSDTVLAQAHAIFPGAVVVNSYGTTEIGAGIFGSHPEGITRPPLSIGYPDARIGLRLLGGASADEGALELRSPTNMTEYLNLPEATAEKMADGWIRTGDLMRRDEDGFFYFVGRVDDMFVCSGGNVYPGALERLLERHPAVLEVAVVSLTDSVRGEVPVAFVVPRPGVDLTDQEIKSYVLERAAPYMHPRRVWFLDRMPLSGVNKIDRKALKMRASQLATTGADHSPTR